MKSVKQEAVTLVGNRNKAFAEYLSAAGLQSYVYLRMFDGVGIDAVMLAYIFAECRRRNEVR